MEQGENLLRRNLLYNTIGSLVYFMCQWLITGLFVKVLSTGSDGLINTGLLATAMAVTNVFLTLASYGMRTFQVSDVKSKYSDTTYIASRVITVAAAILLCVGFTVIVGYTPEQAKCIYIFLLYKLLEAITDIFHGCCQKHERMDIIGISYGVRGVISIAVFSLMLYFTQNLVLTLAAMTVLCYAFSAYYDIWHTRAFYKPLQRVQLRSVMLLLAECAPLAIYVFLNTATASIPKLMLERMLGTPSMAIYSLVNSPVLILQVGVTYLFAPFITVFAHKLGAGDKKGFLKLAAYITLGVFGIGVAGIAGVLVLGQWGLNLLYGAEIALYHRLLVPMVICTVFTSLSLFYCMLLTVMRDMRGLIAANVFGIAVSLLISRKLIEGFAMYGTTYAAIIALVCQCALLCLFGFRKLNKTTDAA
ncbi:MAG: oligosaccharide flippase family protein [Oscillospiraceae bacterium]